MLRIENIAICVREQKGSELKFGSLWVGLNQILLIFKGIYVAFLVNIEKGALLLGD